MNEKELIRFIILDLREVLSVRVLIADLIILKSSLRSRPERKI